jgi:dipeptidyl aminopeptidase/acylaminoacyl peptidase
MFANPLKISRANPEQDDFIWATAEMFRWKTFDGKEEEGILYKPENFDPRKKYPMIVTFYELRSDRLHTHIVPKPSRSPINMLEYASNGYLVFVPNIRYTVGNPGESAVNYVVSGTKAIIEKGFVDKNRIGIQGQSWGAYQVAYIITQTNLYKAACAFAPVSNMTSAYGEIVWQLGYSRMSMYESSQSRLGTTLWEKPEVYVQNSPIFYADKIETPLMIVHNDGDGTVPWNQGIALFVALRRLNKSCWLLNYNGEPHNLRDKSPESKDFSIRMFQFFNHYLASKPEPLWMKEGIPALKKGKELGYEIKE